MTDPRDYKLELSGAHAGGLPRPHRPDAVPSARPYLSVQFACCGVYQRIYRAPGGNCYQGRCPRCGKSVRFPIGPAGTSHRFFIVR
jgi:hypothetical protein